MEGVGNAGRECGNCSAQPAIASKSPLTVSDVGEPRRRRSGADTTWTECAELPGRSTLLTGCLDSSYWPYCVLPDDDPSYRETLVPSPYPPPSLAALDAPHHERRHTGGLHHAGIGPTALGATPPPRQAVDEEPANRPASRHALDNMPEVTGKGRRLLESAGWKEGTGLGRQEQGAARSVTTLTTKQLPDS